MFTSIVRLKNYCVVMAIPIFVMKSSASMRCTSILCQRQSIQKILIFYVDDYGSWLSHDSKLDPVTICMIMKCTLNLEVVA